jgi:hypothetical protein
LEHSPLVAQHLPELIQLEALIERGGDFLRPRVLERVEVDGESLPIWCIEMGSQSASVPAVGYFGGVHGMERIGTQVLLAYLHTLVERLHWDEGFRQLLGHVRLVFVPMLNPGGLWLSTRANPQGVDLMRNAPVDATGAVPFLVGGQRISKHLPWYRGEVSEPLQPEAQALFKVVRETLHNSPFSLAMDCHSGFGFRDRIWFPYARVDQPAPHLPEAFAVRALFNQTYPHHSFYIMEPQSVSYTTHGDLWDCLYDEFLSSGREGTFLPFTLEMGSWLWVKKNPRQFFSWIGHFNPILPHRLERVLRRHLTLLDFLLEAAVSHRNWLPDGATREAYMALGRERWY